MYGLYFVEGDGYGEINRDFRFWIIEEIEEKHVAGCGISMCVSPVYFSCEGESGRDTD